MTKQERDNLIKDNYKLVYFVVNKYFKKLNTNIKEELISEGFLSLVNRTSSFDASKGYSFTTYIVKCIYHDLIRYLKKYEYKYLDIISLDEKISENDLTYLDIIENKKEDLKYIDLYTSLSKLPKHKYNLILKIFLEDKTQTAVAKELGISKQRVNKLLNTTLSDLRDNISLNMSIKNNDNVPSIREIANTLGISLRTCFRKKSKGIDIYKLYNDKINSNT